MRAERVATVILMLAVTVWGIAGCAATPVDTALADHPFDGTVGHEVMQHDRYRYTLRYYAPPQADRTAMENLLLHHATRICGWPGFRRSDPFSHTLPMEPRRTENLVLDFEQPRAAGPDAPDILYWVEIEVDCERNADASFDD